LPTSEASDLYLQEEQAPDEKFEELGIQAIGLPDSTQVERPLNVEDSVITSEELLVTEMIKEADDLSRGNEVEVADSKIVEILTKESEDLSFIVTGDSVEEHFAASVLECQEFQPVPTELYDVPTRDLLHDDVDLKVKDLEEVADKSARDVVLTSYKSLEDEESTEEPLTPEYHTIETESKYIAEAEDAFVHDQDDEITQIIESRDEDVQMQPSTDEVVLAPTIETESKTWMEPSIEDEYIGDSSFTSLNVSEDITLEKPAIQDIFQQEITVAAEELITTVGEEIEQIVLPSE